MQAETHESAIKQAEKEAEEYCSDLDCIMVDFAQSFEVFSDLEEEPVKLHKQEVFSLMRSSDLPANQYVDLYFDTGLEHQQTAK
ncbi:MAG: hypothetical protein MRY72_04870 [Aquisalinus sp.]|nr:hypothetical protein [Aquisalinus sp.]